MGGHSLNKSKSPSKKPINKPNASAKTKKLTPKQQAELNRLRQDSARRMFFSQKLPDMGKLWMHQLLLDRVHKEKMIRPKSQLIAARFPKRYDEGEVPPNYHPTKYNSLSGLNDPSSVRDGDGLDPNGLAQLQIYGYDKFKHPARNRPDNEDSMFGKYARGRNQNVIDAHSSSTAGFGGEPPKYPFIRGVLTEQFQESKLYEPRYLNSRYRALVPFTKLSLTHQFLCTPMYLKDAWTDLLETSYKLKPKIILIDDDERILTARKNCNVYVQFMYENEGVLGANKAYQLMLPNRGPTEPTRPLRITPEKLGERVGKSGNTNPAMALREAPVYVYHRNGNAFYENIAQYLAGRYPQISPKTVRKMMQFADVQEFEEYLASKVTREEARRITEQSGEDRIDVESVRRDLFKLVPQKSSGGEHVYYHRDCEQNPLGNLNSNQLSINDDYDDEFSRGETKEYVINDKIIHSTFVGFTSTGEVEKVRLDEVPVGVLDTIKNTI